MYVTFREYTEGDKTRLIELAKELADMHKVMDPMKRVVNGPGFVENDIAETLENVAKYRGKIWFAEDSGKLIGYIIGVIWEQSEQNKREIGEHMLGEVVDLYLQDAYRGQGLGTKMLAKMEEYFQKEGCDSMWVSHFADNENAHKAYEKFGFVNRSIGMLKTI